MTKLFYFTGTGNSLQIALELKKHLRDVELTAIKEVADSKLSVEADQVGFIFPVYFYGLPRIVHRLIENMEFKTPPYIFAVATAMYPDGIAISQLKDLLKEKGLNLDYGRYIKMPTNYVSFYEPNNPKKEGNTLRKASGKVKVIAKDIMVSKSSVQKENSLYQMLVGAHKSYDRWKKRVHETDKDFMIQETCNGCGVCEQVCPVNNIEIMQGVPTFKHECEQCYGCINLCPKKAIGYAKMKTGRYKNPDITVSQIIGGE